MFKLNPFHISRQLAVLAVISASYFLTGCGEKTAEQKSEELRADIRETKRAEAVKNYKILAQQFPEHPRAGEALQKAAQLEAKKK